MTKTKKGSITITYGGDIETTVMGLGVFQSGETRTFEDPAKMEIASALAKSNRYFTEKKEESKEKAGDA